MSGLTVILVTVLLIVLSAFFVVIEFSLMGARRHRLETSASESASARAALRGMNELTLMLAAAQLGITGCTFALGAITKPALDYALGPLLLAAGLPEWFAGALAFGGSLLIVTFLHLVVGEMAPKSWAIAHPELAAKIIGISSRAYLWPLRPFLKIVNSSANALVRMVGVTPVERAAVGGHDADTIRQLVEHSAKLGVLEPQLQSQISEVIQLQGITAGDIIRKKQSPASVTSEATVAEVQQVALSSSHLRILVRDESGKFSQMVHVRDTLKMNSRDSISSVLRPCFEVDASTPVYELLQSMREKAIQLAIVNTAEGQLVVTIKDIVRRILPNSQPQPANAQRQSE